MRSRTAHSMTATGREKRGQRIKMGVTRRRGTTPQKLIWRQGVARGRGARRQLWRRALVTQRTAACACHLCRALEKEKRQRGA
jgi:hypothetical protein